MTPAASWLRPDLYDASPASLREHAEAIAAMMSGRDRLWLGPFAPPTADDGAPAPLPAGFEDTALVVPTSGSTGQAKAVALSRAALLSSQDATAEALGGHGFWLPLLPPTHIAGVQVIARAVRTAEHAGLDDPLGALPAELPDLTISFTPGRFVELAEPALARARELGLPAFTSLVPTQLARVVQDPSADGARARRVLAAFDGVLVGGAATPPAIRVKARDARLRLTYGSSETAGGCVYDGAPLRGVRLGLEHPQHPGEPATADAGQHREGRLLVSGPSLALGYLLPDGAGTRDGFRGEALVTSDLASLDAQGRLTVIGRADDVIITGGKKVLPQDVERILEASLMLRGMVAEAVIVGVPDAEWGQRVEALAVAQEGTDPAELHALVRSALRTMDTPPHQIPKRVHAVTELPRLGIGKIDRARAAQIARELDAARP